MEVGLLYSTVSQQNKSKISYQPFNQILSMKSESELVEDLEGSQQNCSDSDDNYTDKLCHKCKEGYSVAIGSNECMKCSNAYLVLFIFFIAAGLLLVFFIKILNMTVSQGTINRLIFYANVVWAYKSFFLPKLIVIAMVIS